MLLVISLSSSSYAVTPTSASSSVNLSPNFILLSLAVITGIEFIIEDLGFTVTVIVLVAFAPWLSSTLYLTVYSPSIVVSTLFSTTFMLLVISLSSSSYALTPTSASSFVNLSPTLIILSLAVITGIAFIVEGLGFTVTTL